VHAPRQVSSRPLFCDVIIERSAENPWEDERVVDLIGSPTDLSQLIAAPPRRASRA